MPLDNPASTVDESSWNRLAELEAEQAQELKTQETPPTDTQTAGDRAPVKPEETRGTPDSKTKPETPSDADKEIESAKSEAEKEGKELEMDDKGIPKRDAQGKFVKRDKQPVEKPIELTADEKTKFQKYQEQQAKGKYAKDAVRRDNSWKALNEEKEKFAQERAKQDSTLKAAIAKFNADVQKFRNEQSATRPTPERFDAYAQKLETDAKLKEAEIIKAEANGDMDTAKKLYAEAEILKDKAGEARKHAEHLRKNPPPDDKQVQEKFKADQGTWIAKANTDFPEFAQKDSPIRNAAVETFKEITSADPQLARLPGLIYHCVKYAAAKTASDRVPAMEKELGELRTKVKELELLTNPTPQGGVPRTTTQKPFEQMSSEEQFEALRAEAAGMKR